MHVTNEKITSELSRILYRPLLRGWNRVIGSIGIVVRCSSILYSVLFRKGWSLVVQYMSVSSIIYSVLPRRV